MVEAPGVEPGSYKDVPKASTCLGRDSVLVFRVGGAHTHRKKQPSVRSRQSARWHGFMTSLFRTPPSLNRHPGEDVAGLSSEGEFLIVRSYFFDR